MDEERLYARAMSIRDRKANGLWLPIIMHLAMRRHPDAMVVLASWFEDTGPIVPNTDPFGSHNLLRRAWRMGNVHAAQNMAMTYFNENNLAKFRLWARRAAELGDGSCATYVKRFETRLPHANAGRIGRKRPWARRDDQA